MSTKTRHVIVLTAVLFLLTCVLGWLSRPADLAQQIQTRAIIEEARTSADTRYTGVSLHSPGAQSVPARLPGADQLPGTSDDMLIDLGADGTLDTEDDMPVIADPQLVHDQDRQVHVADTDVTSRPGVEEQVPADPTQSPTWAWLRGIRAERTELPAGQNLTDALREAWACRDSRSMDTGWQLSTEQADAVPGPAVLLPSVCAIAPLIDSDPNLSAEHAPSPPWAMWHRPGPPPGSALGSSLIVAQAGYATSGFAPIRGASRLSLGAPVVIRDARNQLHRYEVVRTRITPTDQLWKDPELFSYVGPNRLILVVLLPHERQSLQITAVPIP